MVSGPSFMGSLLSGVDFGTSCLNDTASGLWCQSKNPHMGGLDLRLRAGIDAHCPNPFRICK